ncbi:uncharacterized protein LOC110032878 [Phalaenopsis equestris]|uniref:uncharacterized protein LOC110032878 n=1 Tax=Phalaenopsis equestris TaxID=78828 RepID=UPI0009E30140|nr:uncharacterized protein LOC110032878 [Phalaenopsis equestris]
MMDPQVFVRLSVGSLGLRIPVAATSKAGQSANYLSLSSCLCEIRLRGFPVQTASVPLISSPEDSPDPHSNTTVFYLEKSDLKALMAHRCFQAAQPYLEIAVYLGRKGSHCGVTGRKQQIGTFRVEVGPEWSEGKPTLLHNGWISFGKNKPEGRKLVPELHLRVQLDPDPRYVFQFDDETASSPQIFQLQGNSRQPIFSCNFSQDRRTTQLDSVVGTWTYPNNVDQNGERRERKGWKVMIYDLSGSAVAAAFMSTPFVPSTGCDWVARSNPGAWLILRPDHFRSVESWLPWGRLEAWREIGPRDSVCLRLHLLPEGQDAGVLVSEIMLSAEKGGEFFVDLDRQTPVSMPAHRQQNRAVEGDHAAAAAASGSVSGSYGFVMNCRVQGEGKSSRPIVQLAMRHVTCVEDAAIFMAVAAAVDLSMEACRPFRRKTRKGSWHSIL